jgi:hypothetical protein
VENRISTVFLNGMPVDDLDTTIPHDGSVLALSAAMPGLAGAILRRGGHLRTMRHQLPKDKEPPKASQSTGYVIIKLFNLILRELGPRLLEQGVRVPLRNVVSFLRTLPRGVWDRCQVVTPDQRVTTIRHLMETEWDDAPGVVRLQTACPHLHSKTSGSRLAT